MQGSSGDMVFVPAGEFKMGDNFNEGEDRERPVHQVYLDAYYIGKNTVTNREYIEFLNDAFNNKKLVVEWNYIDVRGLDGKYYFLLDYSSKTIKFENRTFVIDQNYLDHPVVLVSWYGAVAYCNWKSEKEEKEVCYDSNYNLDTTKIGYRLPTEAEWEKAARGTDQRRYPWGNEIDGSYTNFLLSGDPFETGGYPWTTPVGFYDGSVRNGFQTHNNASPYGVFDMAGNVWEWCYDWYLGYYYQYCVSHNIKNNPLGPPFTGYKVVRGGDWSEPKDRLRGFRSADRSGATPESRASYIGFRIVLSATSTNVNGKTKNNPEEYELFQNYPNPFNSFTEISFKIKHNVNVKLEIYNIVGEKIITLIDNTRMLPGTHSIKWNGRDSDGNVVASGIYIYKLSAGKFFDTKKMIFLK